MCVASVGLAVTKLLAPILPCITEEIYQELYKDTDGAKSVHLSKFPEPPGQDESAREVGEFAKEIAATVRRWKSEMGLALNEPLTEVQILLGPEGLRAAKGDLRSALVADDHAGRNARCAHQVGESAGVVFTKTAPAGK